MIRFTLILKIFLFFLFFSCKKDNEVIKKNDTVIINSKDTLWTYYKHNYLSDSINQFPAGEIRSIIEYNKEIWITTGENICVLRAGKWLSYKTIDNPSILREVNGNLIVSKASSNSKMDYFLTYNNNNDFWNNASTFNSNLNPYTLKMNIANAIYDYVEYNNQLFFSLLLDSVVVCNNNQYSILNNIPISPIRFKIDSKNRLWLLSGYLYMGNRSDTLYSKLMYYYNNELKTIKLPGSLKLWDVNDVEDWDGIVISSEMWQKNYKLVNNEWIDITDKFPSKEISSFVYDKKGTLWITTYDKGIAKYYDNKWTIYTDTNHLKTNFIRSIYFDSHNILWIPSPSYGLISYKGEKI